METIPRGFQTYSLFLICNSQWVDSNQHYDLGQLYGDFIAFGRAIGDRNLAVWFWISPYHPLTPTIATNVDVERSARFCQQWNLPPSKGPYLVVISAYPDESHLSRGLPKPAASFALGNMGPNEIASLLSQLTDDLLLGRKIQPQTPSQAGEKGPDEITDFSWVRLLNAVQKTMNDFGCAWTFEIKSGPINASVHSCQKSTSSSEVK